MLKRGFGSRKHNIMKYNLLLLFLSLFLTSFSQKGGFDLGNPEPYSKFRVICYSDGADTLSGKAIDELIAGNLITTIYDLSNNKITGAVELPYAFCDVRVVAFQTLCDSVGNEYDKCKFNNGSYRIIDPDGADITGTNITLSLRNCDLANNTDFFFGNTSPPVQNGDLLDNSTYVVTDDGTESGQFEELWKWDAETATWYQVPINDIDAHEISFDGLILTSTVEENGAILTDTADLSSLISSPDYVEYGSNNTPPTGAPEPDIDTYVLPNGDRYDWNGTAWVIIPTVACQIETTRAAVIALRNSGQLEKDCHYVINDPNVNGTLLLDKVLVHAVDESTLSGCYLFTQNDNTAWNGAYDIDTDRVEYVYDHRRRNKIESYNSVISFPYSCTSCYDNQIKDTPITYTSGSFYENVIDNASQLVVGGTSFYANKIGPQSNVNVTGGRFHRNNIQTDATINQSNGTINELTAKGSSITTMSSTGTIGQLTIGENSNLTVSATGSLTDSDIGQDAEVTLISATNYENVFGASTIYRQVGTGYIRYSTIEGTTSFINGNTNVSNVRSYVSTINTTGSTGTLSNTDFNRAYAVNMQNIASLTITDSSIKDYASVSANNAARLYFYRGSAKDGSRILISTGSRIDASYTHLNSYAYLQSTGNGGVLTANYCIISSSGYIRNTTTNSNRADRVNISSSGNVRFDGTASDCRVYYSSASDGASIYHTGASNSSYIYYCTANGLGQIYTQGSVNARIYYSTATSRGYVRSLNVPATHYIYYSNASASGYIQFNNATAGRIYGCNVDSQSILEKRGATNVYYSSFSAYYYAYITRTAGTSSGLFGMGRRTHTITNPATVAPYNTGAAWQNF